MLDFNGARFAVKPEGVNTRFLTEPDGFRLKLFLFLKQIFWINSMYPENPEGTPVIVGSMYMGYVSDTARTWTRNLFRPKCSLILLGHSDEGVD